MHCPFCNEKKPNRHLIFCKENKTNLSKPELRKLYLEYNFPKIATYDNIIRNYMDLKKSLPEIYKEFGIDYNSIKFILEYYGISIRSYSEGTIQSMSKREKTNIERYGAKNVLSKGTVKYKKRNDTVKEKYGVDNVFQIPEIIEKINDNHYYLNKYGITKGELASLNSKLMWNRMSIEEKSLFVEVSNKKRNKTWNEKYGGHPIKNDEIISRIKAKNNERYGVDFFFQSDDFLKNVEIKDKSKLTSIRNGHTVPEDLLKPFERYKRKCRRLTKRVKNELFENWNGHDYYDNEFIREYLNLENTNRCYPTIDHKISIYFGFINEIPEEEICKIENLCITKRSINSSKRHKIWKDIIE